MTYDSGHFDLINHPEYIILNHANDISILVYVDKIVPVDEDFILMIGISSLSGTPQRVHHSLEIL